MNSTQTRGHGGLRLWLLLVTIGVVLVAAFGLTAKPAWAQEANSDNSPATSAEAIAQSLGWKSNEESSNIKYDATSKTVTITGDVTVDKGPIFVAIAAENSPVTINVTSCNTLTIKPNENGGAGFLIGGQGTVNFTGGGTIVGGGIGENTTYTAIQVGIGAPNELAGFPTVVIDMPGGTIRGGNNTSGKDEGIGCPALMVQGSTVIFNNGTLTSGTSNAQSTGMTQPTDAASVWVWGSSSQDGNTNHSGSFVMNGGSVSAPLNSYGQPVPGSAGIRVEGDSDGKDGNVNVTVTGSAEVSGGITCANFEDQGQDTKGNAVNLTVTGNATVNGGINNNYAGSDVGVQGNATVEDGITNTYGTTEISQSATVNGNVVNNNNGTINVSGGQINGNLENNSTTGGTIEWSGGQVSGKVEGVDTVAPPAEQGSAAALQGAVIGVKAPVIAAMAPYGTVTVSSAGNVWNIDASDGAKGTPVSKIASTLVAPIVNAVAGAGSPSMTSVQNSKLTISLPSSAESVLSFSQGVLEAAIVNTDANLAAPATLGDLEGLTCGINAATDNGFVTYTFNFLGEAPTPPEPTVDYVAVYRLYNPYDFLHIYTSDANEMASLKADGWDLDFNGQPCWYAPAAGSDNAAYQVIRLYNPFSHDHYFVPASDTAQINQLTGLGWQRDSAASSIWSAAAGADNVQIYTLFNRYNEVDTHLWTANRDEVDALVNPNGWELNTTTMWGVNPAYALAPRPGIIQNPYDPGSL